VPNLIATLLGKRYRISFEHPVVANGKIVDGSCDPPNCRNKTIHVDSNLTGARRMEILIHEMLHACDWHKDESWVETAAQDISRVLWRLGYRGDDGME